MRLAYRTFATKKQLSAATMRSYSEYMFEKSPAETTSGTVSSDASFTASAALWLWLWLPGLLSPPSSSPAARLGDRGEAPKLLLDRMLTRRTESLLARGGDGAVVLGNTLSSVRSKYADSAYIHTQEGSTETWKCHAQHSTAQQPRHVTARHVTAPWLPRSLSIGPERGPSSWSAW